MWYGKSIERRLRVTVRAVVPVVFTLLVASSIYDAPSVAAELQDAVTFRGGVDLVTATVSVRDRKGRVIRNLKQTDFETLGFGVAWANKGSNQGNCEQCHTSGAYGFEANDDNAGMYETLSTNKYYMMAYFAPDISNLADAKMVPNFPNFVRVGLRQVPHQEHPAFNTDLNDGAFQKLQQLYDLTMGYKAAGTCGPPRIPQ